MSLPGSIEEQGGADVRQPASTASFARLVIRNAEGAIVVKDVLRHTTLIGNRSGCNIQLIAPDVAPVHCALTFETDGLHVRPIRSTFGTRLNGSPVDMAGLSDGDELQIGPFTCRLETKIAAATLPPEKDAISADEGTRSGTQSAHFARLVIRNREGAVVQKDLAHHTTLIGSLPGSNVLLVAPEISPVHCLMTRERDGLRVRDLRSRNGTRVNGRAMEICWLRNGDCVEIGPFACRVETSVPAPATSVDNKRDARFDVSGIAGLVDSSGSDRDELAREREHLASQAAELDAERQRISALSAQLEMRVRQSEADLNDQRTELAAQKTQLDSELHAFQAQVQEFDAKRDSLRRDLARFDASAAEWESVRERFHLEHQRRAAEAEQLAEQSDQFEKQRADLLVEKRELSIRADRLRTEQAECAAAHDRLEAERKELESQAEQFGARSAAHDRERDTLSLEQERASQAAAALERERLKVSQDRMRLESDLQEIGKISSRQEAERVQLSEEESRQAAAKSELEQQREKLNRQEAVLGRAAADVQERNEDLLYRRQQLRAEQAFLRSGKRQFHAALHEFRAEQERFRRAVASIKIQRRSLRRQRREIRAAIASGNDPHTTLIPFRPEWVSPGWLRGLSDDSGMKPRLLDIGETSCLFVAEENESGRQVVLKLISSAYADAAGRQEIELRWRESLQWNHPNIVQTYRVDGGGNALCLAMESVEGITLRELLALHGFLTWREAAGYAFQAALGLEHLHEAGVIHGNIRPSHLLIEEDGSVKILVSGVSGGWTGSNVFRDQPGHDLSEAADYVAPEQTFDSSPVDQRADIYSLGCVLYHALTGTVPFSANTVHQKVEAHRTKLVLPPQRFAPDIPKDLVLAIKKMTAKQPEDRFPSGAEAAQALAPFARRVPAWIGCEPILASRIDRLREQLFAGAAQHLLEPDLRRNETLGTNWSTSETGRKVADPE